MAWGQGRLQGGFAGSLCELLSRFVPETAPLEGSKLLEGLQGPFVAAASERAQADIARATPFDGERMHLKKPVALSHNKEKRHVKFLNRKVYTTHSAWGLVQHHVQAKL